MGFNPRAEYVIQPKSFGLRKFHAYRDKFITRPAYQRKNVWSTGKKQALVDSFFRRYYVPKLVMREVRLSDDRTVDEIIDGQQRITTLQEFYAGEFKTPASLSELTPELAGKYYDELTDEVREYFDELELEADRILNIEDPKNPEHLRVATEIFWRLQQGESLNQMEVAHARVSSLVRNFLVKFADDITFDFARYRPIDENPAKHNFFRIIERKNERMEHLSMLARMLLVELHDGPTDVRDGKIIELIDDYQRANGIGDDSYENEAAAKNVLSTLTLFHALFKNDPMLVDGGTIKELSREYFILSFFILLRHLRGNYVIDDQVRTELRLFFDVFYERWRNVANLDDRDMLQFANSRQQSPSDLRDRDLILRQLFFEHLKTKDISLIAKDTKRAFDEGERIAIYRRGKGLCAACLGEGKPETEATVPWNEFEADHIVAHAKGGETVLENAQLLCKRHNRSKGSRI